MSTPEHKQYIWNLIKEIRTGMLVTKDDKSDDLGGRPMSLVQDEYDGTLYFYTSKDSSKVFEVQEDREVCLTFAQPDDQIYVSLSGRARVNHDRELIDRYWSPFVAAWFPEGKEDPEITMLEIKVNSGEHWKTEKGKIGQLFEIAKANITDSRPDMGENEKFS